MCVQFLTYVHMYTVQCMYGELDPKQPSQSGIEKERGGRAADSRAGNEQLLRSEGMTTKSSNNRGGESHLAPFSLLFSLSPIPPPILLLRSRDGKPRGKRKRRNVPVSSFLYSLFHYCTYGVHWMYNRGILSTPQKERKGRASKRGWRDETERKREDERGKEHEIVADSLVQAKVFRGKKDFIYLSHQGMDRNNDML